MNESDGNGFGISTRNKWFRLGLAIAFLHATFTLLIVVLLQVDLVLAVTVATVVGTVGAIALTVFVLYVY
jgi:hypothetical protein